MTRARARSGTWLLLLLLSAAPAHAGELFASVGTGELDGLYYPAAREICQAVNRGLPGTGVRCSPETTPGSVYNADAIGSGELEFAIMQPDVASAAYNGRAAWAGKPVAGLRTVLALYPEVVTVIARAGAAIHGLADLAGKRLNVGTQGSGTRATWDAIEAGLGWTGARRVRAAALRTDAATRALCRGEIDASLLVVGHPSPLVRAQLAACPANLVPFGGAAVELLLESMPYYRRETIPGAPYGLAADVPSVGSRAVLATSSAMDARVVGVFARAVLSQLDDLRSRFPAFAGLAAEEMVTGAFPAPLHPGAVQAYQDLGLAK